MEHKDLVPGCRLLHKTVCGCKHLVILLSSDIEPGFGPNESWWRCASFYIGRDGMLLGAQVVLFTVHELFQMECLGNEVSGSKESE